MRNGDRYGLVSSLPFDVETLPKDIPKQNAFISRFPKYCLTCFWNTISCCSKPPTGTPSPNSTASVVDVLQRCLPTKDWIRMAGWSMAKCGMARKGWAHLNLRLLLLFDVVNFIYSTFLEGSVLHPWNGDLLPKALKLVYRKWINLGDMI